jgi:hypothetical protein
MPYIQRYLGHKNQRTTGIYIDIAMSPLHEAAERYGTSISRAFINNKPDSDKPDLELGNPFPDKKVEAS